MDEDLLYETFDRAARTMRIGAFEESAELFELALRQPGLSADRRVVALAGSFTAWHLLGDREGERRAARRFFRPTNFGEAEGVKLSESAAAEIRWLRHVALRVVAAEDAETRRSVASPRNPIPVLAPSEAMETLSWVGCGASRERSYEVLSDEDRSARGGRFKVLRARCGATAPPRTFWFDLSTWDALMATHLSGTPPPIGFTEVDAARVVTEEFGAQNESGRTP